MTNGQKVIKLIATAFALYLIVNIFGAIFIGVGTVSGLLGLSKKESSNASQTAENLEALTGNFQSEEVATLKIEVKASKLKIITGDVFKAESNSKNISCTQNNNQLMIEEKGANTVGPFNFYGSNASELVVTVPKDLIFDAVKIDAGAGSVYIAQINAKSFSFGIGAGEADIDLLNVTGETEIETGLGKTTINNANLNNASFDLGVGEINVTGTFKGKTEMNAGVGAVTVNLLDKIDNYRFKVDKGIGEIRIGEVSISDGETYGNGENGFEIDGGIGEIVIKEK